MSYFKNRPILVDIVTVFISLLLLITGTIIYTSYQENRQSFLKMGAELVASDHQQVVRKLTEFLSPQSFIKTTTQFIEDGVLTLDELYSLSSFMHIMLAANPEFNNVYISDEQGNVFFENRYKNTLFNDKFIRFNLDRLIPPSTRFISQMVHKKPEGASVDLIFKDQTGRILVSAKNIPAEFEFNAQNQPWYIGAKKDLESTWVDFSTVFGTADETLVLAHAVAVDNQFRGVVAADINLENLNAFLQKLVTYDQSIFIVSETGKIIAHSKNTPPANLNLDFVCQNQGAMEFKFLNENDVAYCTNFQVGSQKKWKIISVTPLDYFIGDLKKSNRHNLFVSSGFLVLGLMLVIFFARRISRPIMKLAHETRKMTQFDVDKKINLVTYVYEINVLLEAIYAFRRTTHSFSKYIPKVLVEKLLEQKVIAKSGGQKKEMTVLFTDIEQFTQIAEQLDPSVLLEHVSEYFEVITSTIHQHSGNVDKYIGDSVMAFWGAPLDDPKQAQDACITALACLQGINKLNEQWAQLGKPKFITRFGLSMGMVVVGNVGSSDRLNYTVLGDSVNLAARLEGLNKTYGTQIMVNEAIYQATKDEFIFRVLDRVVVKGKTNSVLVYELLGVASTDAENTLRASQQQLDLATQFNRAFDALENHDIDLAHQLFLAIKEQYPNDIATQMHLNRILKLSKSDVDVCEK